MAPLIWCCRWRCGGKKWRQTYPKRVPRHYEHALRPLHVGWVNRGSLSCQVKALENVSFSSWVAKLNIVWTPHNNDHVQRLHVLRQCQLSLTTIAYDKENKHRLVIGSLPKFLYLFWVYRQRMHGVDNDEYGSSIRVHEVTAIALT